MSDRWGPPDPRSAWTPPPEVVAPIPPVPPLSPVPPVPPLWFPLPPSQVTEAETVDFDVVRWLRETTAAFLTPFVAMLLLAAPLGLLWVRLTPRIEVLQTGSGLQLAAPEGQGFFALDGVFLILSVVAGLLGAGATWLCLRGRGPAVPLGLVLGALLAAQIAQEVGGRVVVDARVHRFCASPGNACAIYDGTLRLRAPGVLVVWALAAAATYLVLALFERDRG